MAVAVGELDGRPIAVSGTEDGTVRVWDLQTGAPQRELLTGDGDWAVMAVAVGELDGRPIAVSGTEDGTVRVWNLQTGAPERELLTGGTEAVTGMALGELDGRPIAVSANVGTVRGVGPADRCSPARVARRRHRGGDGRGGR